MKNKIAIASAFFAASSFSFAEIAITENLSFEGFVDMSYSHTDIDSDFVPAGATDSLGGSDNSFAVDQVEINWLFDFNPVTGQIDLEYEESGDDLEVEQAFATYNLDSGSAITAGRYASMLGFEAFEPTGLYQFSFAYDIGAADVSVLPGYAQGVKYTYEADGTFFGISLQDEAFDNDPSRLGGSGDSTFAVEAAGAFALGEGLTLFLGGAYEDGDADDSDNYVINAYATYETGAWVMAAEVNYGLFEAGSTLATLAGAVDEEEIIQALIMANFAYSEAASVTGRVTYSDHELDTVAAEADFVKATLAHNYAFTDNLLLVAEVSFVDGETADEDYEALVGALELLFTF